MSENIGLTWDNYEDNNKSMLSKLYETSKFADITLVCDDQMQVKVHKFVLSHHSSVFRNILNNDANQTCIYLRGISHIEMKPILQFMYLGEATISREKLDECLNVAKDLDVQQLSSKLHEFKGTPTPIIISKSFDTKDEQFDPISIEVEEPRNLETNLEIPNQSKVNQELPCPQCEYKFIGNLHLERHIQQIHRNVRHTCKLCEYDTARLEMLMKHEKTVHGITHNYQCNQCDYNSSSNYNLQTHVKRMHNTKTYNCKLCKYSTTFAKTMTVHIRTMHPQAM